MKKYILLILFIICAVFISGCQSDANWAYISSPGSFESSANMMAAEMAYDMDWNDGGVFNFALSDDAESYALRTVSTASAQPIRRKIIRNADVNIEVPDVEQAYAGMFANLERHGGYEASKSLESWSGYTYIRAELRIPADFLDVFLREIAQEGEVRSQNIYSSDITDSYYDFQTRLLTLEKTLAKYYEFLDNAQNVEEQLQVSSYIGDLTYQIESLKGTINRWDFLVAYSSVSLYLYKTPEDYVEPRVIEWSSLSLDDMGYLIKSGFVNTSSFIVNMFQRIFIALIAGSPVIIPAAAVIFLLIRRARKKKRMKSLETPEIPEDNQ